MSADTANSGDDRLIKETGIDARIASIIQPTLKGAGFRLVRVRLAGEHRPMVIGTATADQFKKSRLMQMFEAHCRSFISDAYIPGMVAPAMDRRLRKP